MRQARPRSGADHDLACRIPPAFAATRREPQSANVFHHPAGEPVLMGKWLAKVVSTFSWLVAHGVCVHRHTLRVKFTYENHIRSLGIQALEGARMKSYLRTG